MMPLSSMPSGLPDIKKRFEKAGLNLKEIITLLNMVWEDRSSEEVSFSSREVFSNLNELILSTVHGTRIERFRPEGKGEFFHTFEIHTEEEEVLGYLNMIYLRKPIPCYYLVYVEVTSPFRRKGLGNKILKDFREFIEKKGAIGILDNIIPPEDKSYNIYTKLGWKTVKEFVGDSSINANSKYMVYIPSSVKVPVLEKNILKLIFRLKKKRPVIEMHDNEAMVKRTIQEFRDIYAALERVFYEEILTGRSTPLMRFMFTKFITKFLGFRRRIVDLLGYTGGESLEQITLSPYIASLPIQSYSLEKNSSKGPRFSGDRNLIKALPQEIRTKPTISIESLPIYNRPYIAQWLANKGDLDPLNLTISDIMDLGFDLTRLREFVAEGVPYIFERISPKFFPAIEKIQALLAEIREKALGVRIRSAEIRVNPSLLFIQDRGNVYILRRKIEGVHWREAFEQLKTASHLKKMNKTLNIDRMIVVTINELTRWIKTQFDLQYKGMIDELTYFVPWDLEKNYPKISIDYGSTSLNQIWIS